MPLADGRALRIAVGVFERMQERTDFESEEALPHPNVAVTVNHDPALSAFG